MQLNLGCGSARDQPLASTGHRTICPWKKICSCRRTYAVVIEHISPLAVYGPYPTVIDKLFRNSWESGCAACTCDLLFGALFIAWVQVWLIQTTSWAWSAASQQSVKILLGICQWVI